MPRPRIHQDTRAANRANARRKTALGNLLATGYIRLHTADAEADAAWIVAQAEGAEARRQERGEKIIWIIQLKGEQK